MMSQDANMQRTEWSRLPVFFVVKITMLPIKTGIRNTSTSKSSFVSTVYDGGIPGIILTFL